MPISGSASAAREASWNEAHVARLVLLAGGHPTLAWSGAFDRSGAFLQRHQMFFAFSSAGKSASRSAHAATLDVFPASLRG